MITPHKYLNLDLSVINVSALIIDKLKTHNLLTYDELLNMTINALGKNAKEVFPYSLNFLFLLGKLHYLPELDLFQLNFD
jgi:hypothetical protein